MVEMIFEKTYSQYHCKQKLSALSEYMGKIPTSSTKKFVKMLVFGKDVGIYNVKDILISKSIGEGTADKTPGEKKVQIVYTGDESSQVMNCKTFASLCKKILEAVENVDDKELTLEAVLEGSNKGTSFRFYYDNETDFVILVRNTNEKGVEKFLNDYQDDLAKAINVPKATRTMVGKDKKPKKPNPHEGMTLISKSDEYGHRVLVWKKNDKLPDDFTKPVM